MMLTIYESRLPYDIGDGQLPIITGVQPFVKWVGGKRRLLGAILEAAPVAFNRYLEPFLGGGAVALAMNYRSMLLNDINSELMNAYSIVRDNLPDLFALLDEHRAAHNEDYFYAVRQQVPISLSPIAQAARFIYLNRTGFNGLYRVNRQGQFNVPFGRYENPSLYSRSNLKAVSEILQDAQLSCQDYTDFLRQHARAGDFIYLDPVYHPISRYSDFKRYTEKQFREDDQRVLAQVFNELADMGAYPVLSNSYCEFTLALYAGHHIRIVEASRNINKDASGRGLIREILVTPKSRK